MIAFDLGTTEVAQEEKKISFEQFLATRPEWPKDRPPVTLEEMEKAIIQGAIYSADTCFQSFERVNIQKPSQYLLRPPGEGWNEDIK